MTGKPTDRVVTITDPQAIDLDCHALIEASAGTGKTYTIENLVVRLLMEEADIQLEHLLLVTFTEKATSELKQRIRNKIEQTLDGGQALSQTIREKLHAALDGFDNAAIFTIHGFCHALLREFPFETGNLFAQELIDDPPLLEKLLREQIHTDWPQRYRQRLPDLLNLSSFSRDPDGFVAHVVELAQRLSGDPSSETVIPDPGGVDIEALWHDTRTTVGALKTLVGAPPALSLAYDRLNINKATKKKILRDRVVPLQQTLDQMDANGHFLAPVVELMGSLISASGTTATPFEDLVPQKWLKAGENLHECPHLIEIKSHLDELTRQLTTLSHALTLHALDQLRSDARTVKARNGWISFQDMLTRVAEFIGHPASEAGLRKVRERYRVAFVDEFQDTDDLQWRIFHTLFMQTGNGNRLFLIGDPKQAIYGFRGADVYTYLDARQTLVRLAARGQAHLYQLNANWRSLPSMVGCFNRIFGQDVWFGDQAAQGPFGIGYPPADSPPEHRLPLTVAGDRSQRPPFNVVDLRSAGSQVRAKDLLATFICREIRFLVDTAGIGLVRQNGEKRPLAFGDIAILVRSQGEFPPLEERLVAASIPYAYYRQPGLFQSRQAHWLSIMLKAIVRPQDVPTVKLALLTPFFDMAPETLAQWPELPVTHPSQRLLADWQASAARRRWGRLFQSLMEESGLIARHCTDPGWERSQTNFGQLFDYLEATAYAKNLDVAGLVAHLDNLRWSGGASGGDADIHQIEDEGNRVQILTMHVSKGLEFPVVFIAGGLTMRSFGGLRVYHAVDPRDPSGRCRKVIDLTGRTGREAARQEFEDEHKRLYYVALTRARAKLYVPFYPDDRKHGWIGPLCTFVSRSIAAAFDAAGNDRSAVGWLDPLRPTPLVAIDTDEADARRSGDTALPATVWWPPQTDFRQRKIALESFSSIGHRLIRGHARDAQSQTFSLIDETRRDDDEPATGLVPDIADLAPADDLPGGTGMGSMFHHIFETIDFQAAFNGPDNLLDDEALFRVIESAARRYRIDTQWAPAIGRIVAHALRQPIPLGDTMLCLGQLTPAQRRHEIEFFFPFLGPRPVAQDDNAHTTGDGAGREMVIRGFVDLVFTWQDRFYIADWKSNRLPHGYGQDSMAQEMAAAGYDLQYQLYTLSILKWLRQRLGDQFDPQAHLGGVLYLFVRGMDKSGSEGVFYVPPERLLPVEALEATIQKRIDGVPW